MFIYLRTARSVIEKLRKEPINLAGARLTGKSRFLEYLRDHFKRQGCPGYLIGGKERSASLKQLQELMHSRNRPILLLVDDLDLLLSPENSQDMEQLRACIKLLSEII